MDDKRKRFEAQVMPHLDAAYRFARWLSRSPGDAEDVVQEAYLRAFRGFDALRGSDVKAWLLTIVRNCHATALKQQQRRAAEPLSEEHDEQPGYLPLSGGPDPESATIEQDQRRTFDRLLASLPQEHREVLMLRELEEMSYREIAAVTRMPIGTVMSRLARARAALRAKWLDEGEGEPRAVR
ncbi:MAG TPA: sigma-70 family RNA polymerase sigma factor [Steroidobacteraceae bacterium]|nr:sigma-70 family RNA polymerase sigma factor [Steroidobacteraceae bacterium]